VARAGPPLPLSSLRLDPSSPPFCPAAVTKKKGTRTVTPPPSPFPFFGRGGPSILSYHSALRWLLGDSKRFQRAFFFFLLINGKHRPPRLFDLFVVGFPLEELCIKALFFFPLWDRPAIDTIFRPPRAGRFSPLQMSNTWIARRSGHLPFPSPEKTFLLSLGQRR